MRPFCANEKCFMSSLEVPDDQQSVRVSLPNGASRLYTRDYLIVKRDGRRYPLCDSCGNIMRVIMGEGEGMRPSTGLSLSGELIGPDGKVVHRHGPHGPGDIAEPEIEH